MIRVQRFTPENVLNERLDFCSSNGSWGWGLLNHATFKRVTQTFDVRSDAEYIRTGKPVVDADKDCDHLQCFGTMDDGSSCLLRGKGRNHYDYLLTFDRMVESTDWFAGRYQEINVSGMESFLSTYSTKKMPMPYSRCLCNSFGYVVQYYNGSKRLAVPLFDSSPGAFFGNAQLFSTGGTYATIGFVVPFSGGVAAISGNYYTSTGLVMTLISSVGSWSVDADGNIGKGNSRIKCSIYDAAHMLERLVPVCSEFLKSRSIGYSDDKYVDSYEFRDVTEEKKLSSLKTEASLFGNWCLSRRSLLPPVKRSEIWGKLAYQSVGNISHLDSNMLAYAKDLPEVGGTIKSLINLVRNPDKPANWASAWLSLRFADRLTIADTKEIAVAFQEVFNDQLKRLYDVVGLLCFRTNSRLTWDVADGTNTASYLANYTVYYTNADGGSALQKCIRTALEWDFYPTLGNLWDLVPYSFVADWFLTLGDLFETVDGAIQANYYNFHKVVKSIKETNFLTGGYPEYANLTPRSAYTVKYERFVQRRLDSFCYQAEWRLPSAINIVDGTSLILQKIS